MLPILLAMLETQEERDKFTLIYEKYYKLLIDIALDILPNWQDAEDAVQQAFVKLIPNLGKIEDIACRKTVNYLVIIVRRVCFDFYNDQNKVAKISYDEIGEAQKGGMNDYPGLEMEYSELLVRVKSLPDIYGDALYLMYCEGFSIKEISETMGITSKTAQKRIERARQHLKELLSTEEAMVE